MSKIPIATSLKSENIIDMVFDKEYNLWIVNERELAKFDGNNVIKINGLTTNSDFKKIELFEDNYLIINTNKGELLFFNIQNYKSKKFVFRNRIVEFSCFKDKLYIIDNLNTIYEVGGIKNNSLPNFKDFTIKKIYRFKEIPTKISANSDGVFFSIPTEGIYILKDKKIKKLLNNNHLLKITQNNFEHFKQINGKTYYLGSRYCYVYEKNSFIKVDKPNDHFIFDLDYGKNVLAFIPFLRNFLIIQNGDGKIINTFKSIDFNKILQYDNFFIASSRTGIYLLKEDRSNVEFLNYKELNNLVIKRKIIEKDNKIYFFGNPYVVILDKNKNIETKYVKNNWINIYDIVDTGKEYYATTEEDGLFKIPYNFKNKIKINNNNDHLIMSVHYDEKNDLLYYGNISNLYYFKTKDPYNVKTIKNPFKNCIIRDIRINEESGLVFVSTEKGLFTYDRTNNQTKIIMSGPNISQVLFDSGKIIAGSDDGFFILNGNNYSIQKKIRFNFSSLPKVTAILKDNYGRYWFSTFVGIVSLDNNFKNEIVYTRNNGLPSNEFNYKSALKLKNGNLVFGGIWGYTLIRPQASYPKLNSIKISDYILIGKDIVNNKVCSNKIKFNADDYACLIYISAKNINDNNNSFFEYKINNSNWISLEDKKYINLIGYPYGSYKISIRGIDSMGRLLAATMIEVSITQKFYKTTFFYAIVILVLFFLIFWLYNSIRKRAKIKQNTIEEISMDLHDEVGTMITKTKMLIEKDFPATAENRKLLENLNQINFNFREYINTTNGKNKSVYLLLDEIVELLNYFVTIHDIDIKILEDIKKDKFINNILYKDIKLCCYELINNTFKYSQTPYLNFFFHSDKQIYIKIIIEEKNLNLEKSKGNGLHNIKKRTLRNGGNFEITQIDNTLNFILFFKL